jgi:hypothetical protein
LNNEIQKEIDFIKKQNKEWINKLKNKKIEILNRRDIFKRRK